MKAFVFLYPIPEYMDHEIELGSYGFSCCKESKFKIRFEKANSEEEKEFVRKGYLNFLYKKFKEFYRIRLNSCIDLRYRKNGFIINYAIFDGHNISDLINLKSNDKIIRVGLDFKTHTTKQSNGEFLYPNQDFILDQLGNIKVIRIAGFHLWDCVDKLAKRAHERGLETLIDEDLTELFSFRVKDKNFVLEKYPGYPIPKDVFKSSFEEFIRIRKERPWLLQ
jgi:hypothetical protein